MFFTVTEDAKGLSGIVNIDANDVCYIQLDSYKRIVEVHAVDKTYYMTGTLTYWIDALKKTPGYRFWLVDRNSIVNVDRIVVLDNVTKVAYFEDHITSKSKYCQIAWRNWAKISEQIKAINPRLVIQ